MMGMKGRIMNNKCEWREDCLYICDGRAAEIKKDIASVEYPYPYCKWCGADIRKPESAVIIKKSGGTWVARYDGVDWLCMEPERDSVLGPHDKLNKYSNTWKPISEIEITDDIARLRPVMISKHKRVIIAYGVHTNRKDHTLIAVDIQDYSVGNFDIDAYGLATVKDLQEVSDDR